MKKGISEILEQVGKETSRKKKVKVLQDHSCSALKMVLGLTYDPKVVWLLPTGPVPADSYKPNDKAADMQGQMYAAVTERLMNHFILGRGFDALPQWKREKLFLDLLETLDPDDARVVVHMKDRDLPYNGLTRKLVIEAFPTLTQQWTDTE